MAGRDSISPPLRAVLLSRDPILGARALRCCADGWRGMRVQSGYEAAAEILSSPVAVLLIDFRSLGGLHRGLLALARRMEVPAAAIAGQTPPDMTGDDLQGLRRIEIEDIPAILAAAPSPPAGSGESSDVPAPTPAPEPAPVPAPALAAARMPAPVPAPAAAPIDVPLAKEKRVMLTPKTPRAKTLTGPLTPEELAFLMEDER